MYVYGIKDCGEQVQSSGSETMSDEDEDKETAAPDKTSGNGRMLRTVGAVGAFISGMLI